MDIKFFIFYELHQKRMISNLVAFQLTIPICPLYLIGEKGAGKINSVILSSYDYYPICRSKQRNYLHELWEKSTLLR